LAIIEVALEGDVQLQLTGVVTISNAMPQQAIEGRVCHPSEGVSHQLELELDSE
jgi:hypothetical protein